MKYIFISIVLVCILFNTNGQELKLINRANIALDTFIVVKDYKIKKVKNLSDLCLNLAYINHINHNFKGEKLKLPLILIDGRIESVTNVKAIKLCDVKDYALEMKHSRVAIYGSKAYYGIINVITK